MAEVFDHVPLLWGITRVGVPIPIRSCASATVAPFIRRTLQCRVFGINLAADATNLWGPFALIQEGNALKECEL